MASRCKISVTDKFNPKVERGTPHPTFICCIFSSNWYKLLPLLKNNSYCHKFLCSVTQNLSIVNYERFASCFNQGSRLLLVHKRQFGCNPPYFYLRALLLSAIIFSIFKVFGLTQPPFSDQFSRTSTPLPIFSQALGASKGRIVSNKDNFSFLIKHPSSGGNNWLWY